MGGGAVEKGELGRISEWFSNLRIYQNPLEGLLKGRRLSPTPRVGVEWGGALSFAYLADSQVMLILLVLGQQLKHY